jgi:hypothetical protein
MAYIGKQPIVGNFVKLDTITTSATTTFNLTNGGVAYSPQSANNCIVSLNGVIQAPTSAYTISGSTIVFDSALTAADVIDFILVLGDVLNIGTPSDNTVGFSKVTSNLITGATSESTIAGGDQILIYDDSASALRKMTRTNFVSGVGGITEADMWRVTASFTVATTGTNLTSNWERVDTDGFGYIGTGMSQASGIFTFPSTGTYLITFNTFYRQTGSDSNYVISTIYTTLDNSTYDEAATTLSAARVNDFNSSTVEFIFNVSSTSNRKCKFYMEAGVNTVTAYGETSKNSTYVSFIRLGDSV